MKSAAEFFREQHDHSKDKTNIVAKYLLAWANIMDRHCDVLTYLDLYSGRGMYEDGSPSTPIKILDIVGDRPSLLQKLNMHFYESDTRMYEQLHDLVTRHPVYAQMRFKPQLHPQVVDRALIEKLPIDDGTFTFIDPCGYHGLTLELLFAVINRWGSDCLFFLSTHAIKRNLGSKGERQHLEELFGRQGLEQLEGELKLTKGNQARDRLIVNTLESKLLQRKSVYMVRLAMEFEDKRLTSHHLVFICKHHRGFAIMKEIMAGFSLVDEFEIPLWLYKRSASERKPVDRLGLDEQILKLEQKLLSDFAGEVVKAGNLIERCHMSKYMYTEKNMKRAIDRLDIAGKVSIDVPREKRMRGGQVTLGEPRVITFS